jgi:hypothetical protein
MPTGKIMFPGGLSGHSIPVPTLPGSSSSVKGSEISRGGGVNAVTPGPNVVIDYGAEQTRFYAGIVPEVAKANYIRPSNQGRMLQDGYNFSRMAQPRNNPASSQMVRGYTDPIQQFAASNTWQIAGATSKGVRAKQPSTKFVSPFASLPIPVRMPWDL